MNITNKHYKIYRIVALAFVITLSLVITTIALAMPVGTYDQCSNDQGTGYTSGDTGCRWINGNLQQSNSIYNEGDATVQRLWLKDLVPGSSHTVTFDYGTTKSGKHAYDYLTTWNFSEGWITDADRCQDITGCEAVSIESSKDIPVDPNAQGFDTGTRQFVMRGGTIDSVTILGIASGSYSGDSDTRITISFTVGPDTGAMCITDSKGTTCGVALWFGAHVARTAQWFAFDGTTGAGSISGSPYHVSLALFDDDSSGSRDNQMASNAIPATGALTIAKTLNNPDGATVPTSFTINYNCGVGFTGSVSVAAGGTATVSDLPIGATCTVSEATLTPITGYTWGTPSITPASIVISDATSTFTLTVGNSITRDRGSFKITKSVSNPDGATLPAAFTGTYDCGTGYTGNFSVAAGASQTISGIPTGNVCSVVETAPVPITGFTWGTITYTPATITISTKGGTFEIVVGNSITRDRGSFKITKSVSNPDGATLPAAFTGTYDCGTGFTGNFSVAAGASQTITGIPTGNVCSVVETAPVPITGYTWGAITYTPATITISTKGGTFEIVVGNSITRDLGNFKITKSVSNPDGAILPAAFTGTYDCGTGFTGNFSVAAGGSQTISGIPTGNVCSVVETAPAAITGYTWGTITYTPATITISTKGGTFEIVVGNSITRDRGSLKITKSVSNLDGATLPATFTVDYNCGGDYHGTVSVAYPTPGFETVAGIPTGSTCSVSEVAPSPITGYTWGTITYTPLTIVISSNGGTFEIVVGNTITRDLGNFKITKSVSNPDGAILPTAFTGTYDCGTGFTGNFSVAAGGSQTISGIPTGNVCSVVETAPAAITGYTWGTITYTPATITISTKGGTFEIVVGNSITRDRGSLKITKSVSNPDGATLPATFTVDYNCGGDYHGTVSVAYPTPGFETVTGIPTGSTCSVSEVAPSPITGFTWGTITYTPLTIIIDSDGGTFEIVVGNSITRDLGNFKITKSVSNPDGATLPAAFTGTYDCGTGYTGSFSVAAGASQTISDIPTGNVCSVVETAPDPITGFTWGTITYTPATITISTKGGTFEIVVGNSITRDLGNFKITKSVSNPDGATLPAAFTGTYDCGTGYTGNFSVAAGGSQTISGIPTGNVCSVVETAPAPITGYTWGTITYTPATITIDTKGGTFEIVVGNSITRDLGNFKITKSVSNPDGATLPAAFTGTYDCGTGYTGSFSVAAGASQTISGIPTGNVCSVVETAPAPITGYTWGTIIYTPATITIDTKGGTFEIVVGNSITRDLGNFKITKSVSNPDGATLPAAFTGTYDCGTGYTGSFSVVAGGSQTITGIPTGNVCSVVETAPAPITGFTWGTITYTPATITISTKGGTFEIVVGNSINKNKAALLPTQTTCEMYRDGPWPTMYDAFFYGVKNSKINNVSPGVIFYYNRITATTTTFTVQETNTLGWPAMLHQSGLNQAILYNLDCTKASYAVSASGTGTTLDPYIITFDDAVIGTEYIIGIKYSPQNLVGFSVSSPYPTNTYFWEMTGYSGSAVHIDVKPK